MSLVTEVETLKIFRGVAQLASVLAWGASGRPFESDHPDQKKDVSDWSILFVFLIP